MTDEDYTELLRRESRLGAIPSLERVLMMAIEQKPQPSPEIVSGLADLAAVLQEGPRIKAETLAPALLALGVQPHCLGCQVTKKLLGFLSNPWSWNGERQELHDVAKVSTAPDMVHLCSPATCPVIGAIDFAHNEPGWESIAFYPRCPSRRQEPVRA